MWKHFEQTGTPPAALGRSRDWNIDLVPKFIMSQGTLTSVFALSNERREVAATCVSVCDVF